jgi:thiamine biosynthesis lipoprotein
MSDSQVDESSRRDFLTGRAVRTQIERAGSTLADSLVSAGDDEVPAGGSTVRLATRAMACDFAVVMNPGPGDQLTVASDALDLVHALEDQMTVYRATSELSRLNRRAAIEAVEVEPRLFALLVQARDLSVATRGAFDPTSGPLIDLWRRCRREGRIPDQAEVDTCREKTGIGHVEFNEAARTVRFDREGVELNLGAIGKGHAVDRAASVLADGGVENFLLHGGHSSIRARGDHNGTGGWPVGIRNPLFSKRRFATLLLKNAAMATSGSNVQYFRHGGRRYGHILDPRTGWPVEGMLSVSAIAPTAAEADALSTAFFVAGVEKTIEYCDNHEGIGALVVPPPRRGRQLQPVLCGVAEDGLYLTA